MEDRPALAHEEVNGSAKINNSNRGTLRVTSPPKHFKTTNHHT